MVRQGARVALAIALSVSLLSGCSGPVTTQHVSATVNTRPGTGDSIADNVYVYAAPRVGEPTGFTTFIERVKTDPYRGYLIDRVMDAIARRPGWVLAAAPLRTVTQGMQLARTFRFADGSSLRLVGSPIGRLGERSKLQTAEVTRAGGPGLGHTIADQVCDRATPRIGEPMGSPAETASSSGGLATAYERVAYASRTIPGGWPSPQDPVEGTSGPRHTIRFAYIDGSALVLVGTPWGRPKWMLDAVEVARP